MLICFCCHLVTVSPNKFHPDFDPKTVILPRGKLPEKKDGDAKQLRSAAEFFEILKPKKEDVQPSFLKSPSPLKKIPPIAERHTPKMSLLERVSAYYVCSWQIVWFNGPNYFFFKIFYEYKLAYTTFFVTCNFLNLFLD